MHGGRNVAYEDQAERQETQPEGSIARRQLRLRLEQPSTKPRILHEMLADVSSIMQRGVGRDAPPRLRILQELHTFDGHETSQ